MQYHKYDPVTRLYLESVEADEAPENSVPGPLPEQTTHYTLAYKGEAWVSVLRPEFEIVNNEVSAIPSPESEPLP